MGKLLSFPGREAAAPPAQKAEEPGEVALPPVAGEDGAGQGGAQGAAPSVP